MDFGTSLGSCLLFALDLSAMSSDHRSFFVCSPYFLCLSPHSYSPHLYLRHVVVWSVICKVLTELKSGLLRCPCLLTPFISSICIDRCLSSMQPEGMPFLPETARPRFWDLTLHLSHSRKVHHLFHGHYTPIPLSPSHT